MSQLKALIDKEVKEALRDKRALMAGLILAFLAPVLIFVLSKSTVAEISAKTDIFVQIEGAEFAPDLLDQLSKENIYPMTLANLEQRQEWQQRAIELIIPAEYREFMLEGRVIELILRADLNEKSVSTPIKRLKDTLNQYASQIGSTRLLLRGIDPSVVQPLRIQQQDTATPNSNALFISNLLIFYLLFGAFVTGLSVAVDTSAGERERNVLELLLSQPVTTTQVVAAKVTSASLVSMTGVVLMLFLTTFAVSYVDLSAIGVSFQLSISSILLLLLLLVPVCLLASMAQLYLAFQAKTFKEAQSTVSMVILLPTFVPFAMLMMDTTPDWFNVLPISGQFLIMEAVMKGTSVDFAALGAVTAVTLATVTGLFVSLAKKLESEKTVLALS